MQRYSVSELARGKQRGGSRFESICILADVRARGAKVIHVWCEAKRGTVNLPYSQIRIHTTDAQRWLAVSVPRWMIDDRQLWDEPHHPPSRDDDRCMNMRTPQMVIDDRDLYVAKYVVDRENRYTLLPGQRMSVSAYGGAA